MRILLVCNYKAGVGGISGQVELLQRHLREEGHVADIFSTKGSMMGRIAMLPRLAAKARAYDVVHVHCCSGWGFLPAVLGIKSGRSARRRVVLTYHGGGAEEFFARHKWLVKHCLLRTDANIVLSGFLSRVFSAYGIPHAVVPNIVEFDADHYRQRVQLTPNFVCTRAHEALYNIPCILKAFGIIQKSLPCARLTLVGGGSLHEGLKKQVSEMGLEGVSFVGKVDNSEIYTYLDKADILLSAPHIDNMPVSLIEAMDAGLLIVSSAVGGVPYMLTDGRDALLFPDDDHEALAAKVLWALDNQAEALRLVAAAHSLTGRYTWESVRHQIYTVYGIHS